MVKNLGKDVRTLKRIFYSIVTKSLSELKVTNMKVEKTARLHAQHLFLSLGVRFFEIDHYR